MQFLIEELPNGRYRVLADLEGYGYLPGIGTAWNMLSFDTIEIAHAAILRVSYRNRRNP